MDERADLSGGLAWLWQTVASGEVEPPRVGLSRERIVQAAIELADADGLEAVSMARVAQRLGFATMSLYRHVASKDELLLLMHDTVWRMPEAGGQADAGSADTAAGDRPATEAWRAAITAWCRDQQVMLRRHPWLERIRLGERAGTPSQLIWIERGLEILTDVALSERDKCEVLLLLNGLIYWEARFAWETVEAPPPTDDDEVAPFGTVLRALVDPGRFPALRRAVDAGAFDESVDRYADFGFGLDVILNGVERLIARRAEAG